jgi:non-specific serine/threonine protein kinase/serine/threonine-protein kinase
MTSERWAQVIDVLQRAMEMAPERRAAFLDGACERDDALRDEVESLLAADEQAGSSFLQCLPEDVFPDHSIASDRSAFPASTAPAWIGRQLGPYEITEKIGEGGMGEVFRARRADDQFQKQVAIKLLRTGEATPFVISRFKNERQILASVDHPNIARLIDGATTEEGIPYLVMELIEGLPIDDYCDAHKLPATQRLKLFLQVCSAVQYAHQRLIVHRDLKPSNVLVTNEGVPKLLDFGIAKILDPGALGGTIENTLTLFRILTPGYASPEQVRGEPITTASDVYSLGVILYELLTGRSPYGSHPRTPEEIGTAVCGLDPEKPSNAITPGTSGRRAPTPAEITVWGEGSTQKLRKRLRGDLDNIVLMALRKEPQRRYSSVELFAADIVRHLDHLPVIARRDTVRYRASKFVARHKAGVLAAASVAIVLVLALIATLHEARVAQRRFNDVRALANSLIFDVHDSIRTLPGATSARRLIVQRGQDYLDRLAAESTSDPSLLRELAAAYEKLASILGNALDANLGNSPLALKDAQHAVELRQTVAAKLRSTDSERELAESFLALANLFGGTGQPQPAHDYIEKALTILKPLASANPADQKIEYAVAKAFERSGANYALVPNWREALESYERSLEVSQQLLKMDPYNSSYSTQVAFAHKHVGGVLIMLHQLQPALEEYRAALVMDEARIKADSENANTRYAITFTYSDIGYILGEQGKTDEALESYGKSVEIRSQLAAADPKDTRARGGLANNYSNMAWMLLKHGRAQEALEYYRRAFSIRQALSQEDPTNERRLVEKAVTGGGIAYANFQIASEKHTNGNRRLSFCRQGESWARQALPDLLQHKIQLRGEESNFIDLLQQSLELCKVRDVRAP